MNSGILLKSTVTACFIASLGISSPAVALTKTTNFDVRINITSECTISATELNFGSHGLLAADVDAESTVTITCTGTTPYWVSLSAGGSPGATTTTRKMTGTGAATLNYSLFRDAARTENWGIVETTDGVAGTGSGIAQPLTVYGRVPAQTIPGIGAYSDTVTATVNY
jgi:spore coat protein U-like protein